MTFSSSGQQAAPSSPAALPDELLAQALAASQAGQGEQAIGLLKRLVSAHPDHVQALYLLGAECAQAGLHADAVFHLSMTVERAPGFHLGRFQLGLLWFSLGAPGHGVQALAPLADLPDTTPLRHYAQAVIALCRNDLAAAQELLQLGLSGPNDNPALLQDMQGLLERVRDAARQGSSPSIPHGMVVSAYGQGQD